MNYWSVSGMSVEKLVEGVQLRSGSEHDVIAEEVATRTREELVTGEGQFFESVKVVGRFVDDLVRELEGKLGIGEHGDGQCRVGSSRCGEGNDGEDGRGGHSWTGDGRSESES